MRISDQSVLDRCRIALESILNGSDFTLESFYNIIHLLFAIPKILYKAKLLAVKLFIRDFKNIIR